MVSRAILNGWPLVPPSKAVAAPAFTVQPSISGTFAVGQQLTGNTGTVTGFPVPTVTRQWLRDGSAISGATGATYTLVDADLGKRIDLSVSAQSIAGSASATAVGSVVQSGSGDVPLAFGDTIAFLGCSVDTDTNWNGLVPALLRKIDQRLKASPYGYYGWPGTRPDEWNQQLPLLLAAAPNVMWVGDWVNATVPGSAPSLASQTSVVESCMQQFGALPTSKEIWLTTTRRVQQAETNGNIELLNGINAWCAAQAGRKIGNARVRFFDAPYDISADGADALDARDTLHDNTRGAFFNRAKKYGDLILPLLPPGRTLPTPGTPPAGNKTANPLFTGSSALTATGTGAANVSGTKADGVSLLSNITSGVTIVAEARGPGQRFTLSGNQPGTSDVYMTISVPGLERGKKYIAYARYQLSAADGVSPASRLRNFGMLSNSPSVGGDKRGPLIAGDGDVPSPDRGAAVPLNPETGIAESIGEPWMVGRPRSFAINGSTSFRFYMTPFVGAVDMMIDFTDFFVVEIHERKGKPFYQSVIVPRAGTSTTNRFSDAVLGPYTAGGFFPTSNSGTTNIQSFTATQANGNWIFQPGDWSGDPDSYDGTVEVMKSGSGTWTQVVASLASAGWAYNFTGYGLAAGDQVRSTVTATTAGYTPTSESEVVTIT